MPDRLTRHVYRPWVRRHGTVIAFAVILIGAFLALYRLENLADKVNEQKQELDQSCQERAVARAAVRSLILDNYAHDLDVQQLLSMSTADPQEVERLVNEALPPLVCD